MRTRTALFIASLALALAGSCGPVEVRGDAYVTSPQLAYVGPDLYVVADYGWPVFYTDGFYWLAYDGVWYRSVYFDRGWVHAQRVPVVIGRIDWPERYAHFHGGPGPRPTFDHRLPYQRPVPRGNRVPPPRPPPARLPAPRDHRR